jgi:signal transduction histidine kinase/pSer/pThr/pTyr-binding forkhead associated (FHA) protein
MIDASPTEPNMNLVIQNGKFKGHSYPMFSGMVIGRGEQAHIYLPDFKASRQHAVVRVDNGRFLVEDLKSHNGTFVNGKRVEESPLADGDIVHIGTTSMKVIMHTIPDMSSLKDEIRVSDPGMTPTIVKRMTEAPLTLGELKTEEYLVALGLPNLTEGRIVTPEMVRKVVTKTRNFAIVNEISKALSAAEQIDDLLTRAIDFILDVISADRGHVIRVDPNTGKRIPGIARQRGGTKAKEPMNISQTIIDWVIRERTAVVSSDAATDQRFEDKKSIVLYNIRSVLCLPMLHRDRVVGVIQLDSTGSGVGFTEDDVELLGVIAPVLAVAIENTLLYQAQEGTIEELRTAHQKLVAAQEQLVASEKMAIMGRFTSGLAHEIRNLMGPLLLADLLQSEYPDDENIQQYTNLMLDAYARIGSLVEEIRLLTQGETTELVLAPHDLRSSLESAMRFARFDQEVRSYELVIDHAEIPPFSFDEFRLKQVLINLVRNAAQAMLEPGAIHITTRMEDDVWVFIDVVDDGVGIAEENQAAIWEPFYSTKGDRGTGLGLDICRRIVEQHGGQMLCNSVVGEGTTMTVQLPLKDPLKADG